MSDGSVGPEEDEESKKKYLKNKHKMWKSCNTTLYNHTSSDEDLPSRQSTVCVYLQVRPRRICMNKVKTKADVHFDQIGQFPEVKNPHFYCKRSGCRVEVKLVRYVKSNLIVCLNDKNYCFLVFRT